jgi:hypothetical protein
MVNYCYYSIFNVNLFSFLEFIFDPQQAANKRQSKKYNPLENKNFNINY